MKIFENRQEAGLILGKNINQYLTEKEKQKSIILAIPRGGIPVAYYTSKVSNIPFYFVISKKITSPDEPEVALGAVNINGDYIISDYAKRVYSSEKIEKFKENALKEVKEKAKKYEFKDINIKDKIVIIVDDGIATGYTAIACSMYAKSKGASKVVLAVPVCPLDSLHKLKKYFDDILCVEKAETPFFAVGSFYRDFHQLEDKEFFYYIEKAKQENLFAV